MRQFKAMEMSTEMMNVMCECMMSVGMQKNKNRIRR